MAAHKFVLKQLRSRTSVRQAPLRTLNWEKLEMGEIVRWRMTRTSRGREA